MAAIVNLLAGAPSASSLTWETIVWSKVRVHVRRLQMRIAKAFREGKQGKAKALQWILTHSFYAKLLAVRRVVLNRGAKTPGVDNVIWKSSTQKLQAALSLKRVGYNTQPLRRIYIPKKQKGYYRPLSIPTMRCRAQQALHLLSLEPIAEMMADKNAYGFRPLRSTADAIEQCFIALAKKHSAAYILEGDIKDCFNTISSEWLLTHTPMDKEILGKWLAAGYIEKGKRYPTLNGAPQGGLISPALLTIVLSGLEQRVKSITKYHDKVHLCVYADDFIITGASREVLERKVKPAVESFLSEGGLSLSPEKTNITPIEEGFDFLGMNIRKYKGKLIIKPAKSSIKRLLADIRGILKAKVAIKTEALIGLLNTKIRGWGNYYRHVCAKAAFRYVDHYIVKALLRWAAKRHPNKGKRWIKRKYFRCEALRNWVFSTKVKDKQGKTHKIDLIEACKIPIRRHVKIRAEATPYNPLYHVYFDKRTSLHQNEKRWERDVIGRCVGGIYRRRKRESKKKPGC